MNLQKAGMVVDCDGHGRFTGNNSDDVRTLLLVAEGPSFLNGGNLGIGTTAPEQLLHLFGDNPTLKVQGDGNNEVTGRVSLRQLNDTGFDVYYDGTDGVDSLAMEGFDAGTSTGVHFAIDALSGNVGIGTTSPEADLHIRGDGALGSILVTPSLSQSNSQIFLTEQQSTSFGMIMRYDGAANQLHFIAQQNGVETDPLVSINRSSAGNVGIGTTAPGFKLEVNGSAGKPGGGSWSNSSDRRLKKNIEDLEGSLDNLLALRGVTYEYKDPESINELHGTRIGMIAQEVEEVFPDWVSKAGHGYKTLTYRGFEALTVEALRELRTEKDAQIASLRAEKNAENQSLQDQNEELARRLERLEALIERMASAANEGGTR